MSYLIQIADPEGLHVTIQSPGLYNPDILEDVTTRCVDAYRDALLSARAEIGAVSFEHDDDDEVDVAELLRVLESLDDDDTDEEEALDD